MDAPAQIVPQPAMQTEYVSAFSIAAGPNEVIIALGKSRATISSIPNNPGSFGIAPFAEWFLALALSPTTAKQLQLSLAQTVKTYEELNGPIPMGPEFKIDVRTNDPK